MALTPNFGWDMPEPGASVGTWGTMLNAIFGAQDSDLQDSKDAGWIESGTFHVNRIPSGIVASKVNAGTFGGSSPAVFPDDVQAGANGIVLDPANVIRRTSDTDALIVSGGNAGTSGANLQLFGTGVGANQLRMRAGSTEIFRVTDRLLFNTTSNGNAGAGGARFMGAVDIVGNLHMSGTLQSGTVPAARLSGTLADARVAESNVTQHEAALSVAASQIGSGTLPVARGGTGVNSVPTSFTGLWVLSSDGAGGFVTRRLVGVAGINLTVTGDQIQISGA